MILLNPGPVNLSATVRNALTRQDLCHREPEFTDLQRTIRQDVLEIYDLNADEWATVLLAGSGTAAVEAMLTTLLIEPCKVLVIENGVYGERMSKIAQTYRIPYASLNYPWGAAIEISDVETTLNNDPEVRAVAVVHHETTTGRLNDLAKISRVCHYRGLTLLVDGVSSFGAEELTFNDWGLSACAATANKCLHGAPGVSFVVVRRDALPRGEHHQRTVYLDLAHHCKRQDNHETAFTQPVHLFHAFAQALKELKAQGGWSVRNKHYHTLSHRIRTGLAQLGVNPLLKETDSSVVLSAYTLPNHISYECLHDRLKSKGFVIYAGQGELSKRIFRVSTMGDITIDDIEDFLTACRGVILETCGTLTHHSS